MRRVIWLSLTALCAMALACQSVKVKRVEANPAARQALQTASKLSVREFTMNNTVIKGDLGGSRKEANLQRWPREIAHMIVANLSGIKPCEFIDKDAKVTEGLVLEGNFEVIDGGSKQARLWVGFSAGESILRARCKIYDAARPEAVFYNFEARGGSKAEGGIMGLMRKMDDDVRSAADHIAKFVRGELGPDVAAKQ